MVNLNSTHLTTSTTYKPGSPTSRPQPLLGKHPRTTGKALRLHRLANAYRGNWEQGALLLQAIQMNAGRPINERMIVETTKRILQAWEPSGVNAKQVSALIRFVRHFVDNTAFPRMADMSLERAIGMLCVGSEAVPVVCPTIAMAVAMGYIERLRKNHPKAKARSGSSQRIFLTAYIIAAKYIHSSLGAVVVACPSLLSIAIPTPTSPMDPRLPPSYLHPPTRVLTGTTGRFATLLPHTTPQELAKMELEFLHMIDFDISLRSADQLLRWWERCIGVERAQSAAETGQGAVEAGQSAADAGMEADGIKMKREGDGRTG